MHDELAAFVQSNKVRCPLLLNFECAMQKFPWYHNAVQSPNFLFQVSIDAVVYTYRYGAGGGPYFRKAMAAFLNNYFQPHSPVHPDDIVGAAGVTAILEMLAFGIADAGDAILANRPIYGRFEVDVAVKARVKIIYANMEGVDPLSEGAVAMDEKACVETAKRGVRIVALLLSNPHNPLGAARPVVAGSIFLSQ